MDPSRSNFFAPPSLAVIAWRHDDGRGAYASLEHVPFGRNRPVIARSPKGDEAIQAASRFAHAALDRFAEPVIGPRDFARVRWLAMTS
jgi:hypothetical protein